MTDSPAVALCRQDDSLLLVIDIQERLTNAMPAKIRTEVLRNTSALISAAKLLDVPVLATEQYPAGLGNTVTSLKHDLPRSARVFEKTCFSACGAEGFKEELLATHKRQVVIAGMEAHVCVLQSALELKAMDIEVFVVEDATCSRDERHHANAVARLRRAGVNVSNMESVLFEWLRDASHKHFKVISGLVK